MRTNTLLLSLFVGALFSQFIGSAFLVGYGTTPDEMVANARYRTIFTVTPPQ